MIGVPSRDRVVRQKESDIGEARHEITADALSMLGSTPGTGARSPASIAFPPTTMTCITFTVTS
ncbi:hypothetical protein ACFQL7_23780 [Halocatena marina]|uniref:Uncharacterized protein n=1 Tax=Halocatena marina TaxID=2934937 RepID=A0ABD5YTB5_9EURY|nr:hypothetical protein [Halocatena marina]